MPRRRLDRRAVVRVGVPVVLVVLSLVLTSLATPQDREPSYGRYVAFGDSFTAAPYVPVTDLASGCLRSDRNYAQRVAEELRIPTLLDRSCTGAQTSDLLGSQRTRLGVDVAPQAAVLSADTDLVTVGLGFNDERLYGRIASRCRQVADVCRLADERTMLLGIVDRVSLSLRLSLLDIRRRAPRARVLLVGYPRMLPPRGDCIELPRMRPQDRATFREVNRELGEQMRLAARQSQVEYVDFYRYSRGHDICSDTPWVQGRTGQGRRAAGMHPLPAGQRALARLISDTLREPPPDLLG
ncbi:SGNH/GDSL hydrolase family protein [Nocardioides aequoreus]|uniref:SGNH/GDSL hydrolase family protein n=1 Tax=Nocardioides aequoreus TaxID=397278 RepID=UPI0004C31ADE|nr:SGNH/GDSL hydrolase family protein [Nocardioides aequoreus]